VLPRELAEEIAQELARARSDLARNESRVDALEALLAIVRELSSSLRREATIDDLVSAPASPVEASRRRQLLLELRGSRGER